MTKKFEDVTNGDVISQDDIRQIAKEIADKINELNASLDIARGQMEILRKLCSRRKHPRKKKYFCPDCGEDWSPDGY